MVLFNYVSREITAKVVYYGPGLGGKTTNLQHLHSALDPGSRGKLLSLATDGDRTLFFDFLPLELGHIGSYKVRFQLYTVPGQVHYNATRKLVLKGVDAVAFVADSQITMLERNRESFENLLENLTENGYEPAKVPIVVQLNKRDLPGVASPEELVSSIGVRGLPTFEAVASRGEGVFETLRAIIKLTISKLRNQFEAPSAPASPPPPSPLPPAPGGVFTQASAPESTLEDEILLEQEDAAPAPSVAAPPPASVPAPTAGRAEIDLEERAGDLEEEHSQEILLEEEVATPIPEGGLDTDARRRAFFEEVELGEWDRPPAEQHTAEQPEAEAPGWAPARSAEPAWAREIREEMHRLRRGQEDLRAAVDRLLRAVDSQIEALCEARAALADLSPPGEAAGQTREAPPAAGA